MVFLKYISKISLRVHKKWKTSWKTTQQNPESIGERLECSVFRKACQLICAIFHHSMLGHSYFGMLNAYLGWDTDFRMKRGTCTFILLLLHFLSLSSNNCIKIFWYKETRKIGKLQFLNYPMITIVTQKGEVLWLKSGSKLFRDLRQCNGSSGSAEACLGRPAGICWRFHSDQWFSTLV